MAVGSGKIRVCFFSVVVLGAADIPGRDQYRA